MRQAVLVIGTSAVILGAATAAVGRPSVAYACSAGNDFNPITESDLIVGGWITDWHEEPKRPGSVPDWPYLIAVLNLDVDRVWKGSPGPIVEFVDAGSLLPAGIAPSRWQGGSSCGAFYEDPQGRYVVLGLSLDDDGRLRSNNLMNFYQGDAPPAGQNYDSLRERLAGWGLTQLPVVGHGADSVDGDAGYLKPLLPIVLSLSLLAGLGELARRRIHNT